MILIAPSFDVRVHGGIERVSCQVMHALEQGAFGPGRHLALASNDDPQSAVGNLSMTRLAYDRKYFSMMIDALRMPLDGITGPVLCLHAGLTPAARILAARMKARHFVFLHGVEVWRKLPFRTRWGLSGANFLLANSRFTMARFAHFHPGLADKPSTVVQLGLTAAFNNAADTTPRATPAGPFILTVSRLSKEDAYKGHEVLMDAVLALRKQRRNVSLVFVGSGDAEEALKARATGSGDPGAFHFSGNVSDSDLLWFYRNCSLFALLSEGEGFGLVFLEAMSQGKPCVATNADAAAEIVKDGITGRVVSPQSAEAAASAIGELLDDSAGAGRMGEAGKQLVDQNFLEKHFVERLSAALSQN